MLCKNEDCSPIKTDIYDEKCSICVGYYKDDGTNDILYMTDNDDGEFECELCWKSKNICRMKKSGLHICANACDESDDSDDEESKKSEKSEKSQESNDSDDEESKKSEKSEKSQESDDSDDSDDGEELRLENEMLDKFIIPQFYRVEDFVELKNFDANKINRLKKYINKQVCFNDEFREIVENYIAGFNEEEDEEDVENQLPAVDKD